MADILGWFTAEHITALAASVIAFFAFAHTVVGLTPTKRDDELLAKAEGIVMKVVDLVKPKTPPAA